MEPHQAGAAREVLERRVRKAAAAAAAASWAAVEEGPAWMAQGAVADQGS